MLIVNAEVDSMGGGIDGRLGILSTLSMQKSSDLEKTQYELRQKFNAAEKFRRELEFLQNGGDPLDLIIGSAESVSVQSTSLADQHPEQFVTSEVKGSFAVTASPHGDSVGSSGRLGAPSVCEPNSADNLVLFDGDNKFPKVERRSTPSERYSRLDSIQNVGESGDTTAALELPKKSYKRRIRSRPNREGALERKGPSSVNLDLKGSTDSLAIKNLVSSNHLDTELDVALAVETTQVISAKGLDSESSCTQKSQNLDVNNGNELTTSLKIINCNGTVEQTLMSNEVQGEEGSNVVKENDCKIFNNGNNKILNNGNNNSDLCHRSHNEDDVVLKEDESLKGSECARGTEADGSTALETKSKPSDLLESSLSVVDPTDFSEQSVYPQNNSNLATKEHEDSILKEAQMIEEKRERIAGSFVSTLPLQNHKKSHWDFVLEEMSWLANDFAQERVWKVTAAAQISRRVAFTSQIRYQQKKSSWKQKEVAQTLGRSVIDFWHTIAVKCKDLELPCHKTDSKQGLQGYVKRFLEYNRIYVQCSTDQVSPNPDMIADVNIIDTEWDNSLTEESLVYVVPPGAVEAYRKSIESHLLQNERTWSGMQEEMDTSGYDAVADNALDEHDGEMRAYHLSGEFDGSRASQATKKRKNNFKFHTARSHEMGADYPYMEKNMETQPSVLNETRPHNGLIVSFPSNHVRTASRQRVLGPFSGDSNSFQDEQITPHGGGQMPNSESAGDFEKQLQYDSVEGSDRPRKKKKHKHSQGSSFDHHWRLDSNYQNDQMNHSKKRPDAHQLDINGTNGLYIQHNLKKLKIRQSSDNSFDDPTQLACSIPSQSPVTSQMSNMSNPKKFMDLLVRDRVRKSKNLKALAGRPGSGSSWSLFEDQFLVVLVHDMGPNWELISDAINSSLQFKRIFRSTKECKERHKMVMDRSTSDGPDSADDRGSSQPYPSTLPGIPEGSARQLFQRLQGPMEEETLKSHFEKIIKIGQKQHYKRKQNNNQDPKQLQQPHSSYALALSQVSPNNLNGGPVLTPLDLCDAIASTPDVPSVGYIGSHSSGLPIADQGSGVSLLPGSSSNSSVPYSSSLIPGNEPSSASVPLNPSVRDGRFGVPRPGSLQKDDQQRMQQYNQLLSARNLQHSNGSPSGIGRGVRMGPTGNNNIGVMPGRINRGMAMARPPFHGVVASPSMMNPANMHLMRPSQNTDHQGQIPHPALGMRIVKERQPQQRVLQQQQQLATPNPIMPHLQVQVSQPMLPPSVKHPLLPSPTHGVGRNPKTCGNQILNQQRQSQQFQQTKLIKGVKSSDNNNNHQSHGPSLVASSSTVMTSRPQTHQKLMNLSQVTTSQNMVNNRLVNSSEPPTSKLHISPPQTSSAGATS